MNNKSDKPKPGAFLEAWNNQKEQVKRHHKKAPSTSKLHPRNLHNGQYDLDKLVQSIPELKDYLTVNVKGEQTVKFAEPRAVLLLNKALLFTYYGLDYWQIPEGFLCPPIPGRADYIHYLADLLKESNYGKLPNGERITCLDIGTGSNLIYPIIGTHEYGWNFIGSETDTRAKIAASQIIEQNKRLQKKVNVRLQPNLGDVFERIIDTKTKLDLVMCNPPFHASRKEAQEASLRKQRNLQKKEVTESVLNFGGKGGELWCEGGERRFVSGMINESKTYEKNIFWFSSLVSKQSNLKAFEKSLDYHNATEIKIIQMSQGNKANRILAWTFLNGEEQKVWRNNWLKSSS